MANRKMLPGSGTALAEVSVYLKRDVDRTLEASPSAPPGMLKKPS
jgi:hypothetical protein